MTELGTQMVADIFKSLSHPIRLQIVQIIKDGPLCVCDILPRIDSEQSNTSQHLAVLKKQGIVESKKDGMRMIYKIKSPEIYEMIDLAENIIMRQIDETNKSIIIDRKL